MSRGGPNQGYLASVSHKFRAGDARSTSPRGFLAACEGSRTWRSWMNIGERRTTHTAQVCHGVGQLRHRPSLARVALHWQAFGQVFRANSTEPGLRFERFRPGFGMCSHRPEFGRIGSISGVTSTGLGASTALARVGPSLGWVRAKLPDCGAITSSDLRATSHQRSLGVGRSAPDLRISKTNRPQDLLHRRSIPHPAASEGSVELFCTQSCRAQAHLRPDGWSRVGWDRAALWAGHWARRLVGRCR